MWWMLSMALAQQGLPVCADGQRLSEDGRCAGWEAPWALPAAMWSSARPTDGGQVLIRGHRFGESITPALAQLDLATGAVRELPAPFATSYWLLRAGEHTVAIGPDDYQTGVLEGQIRRLDLAHGRWVAGRDWPEPVRFVGGTSLSDGRVLLIGGFADDAPQRSAWTYDPASDGWQALKGMPSPRISPAVLPLKDGFLVCGGTVEPWIDNREAAPAPGCDRWDGKTWSKGPNPPAPHLFAYGQVDGTPVASDGTAFWWVSDDGAAFAPAPPAPTDTEGSMAMRGGLDSPLFVATEGAWRLTHDGWESVAEWTLPEGRRELPIPLSDGTWLLADDREPAWIWRDGTAFGLRVDWFPEGATDPRGGLILTGQERTLHVDGSGRITERPPATPKAHSQAVAAFADGSVLQFGGTDGNSVPMRESWFWPADGDAWQPGPEAPVDLNPRILERTVWVILDGRVFAFPSEQARHTLAWRPGETDWTELDPPPFEPMAAIPIGGRLWVLGRPEGSQQQAAWLDPDTGWTPPTPVPDTHVHPAIAVLPDQSLFVAGGVHQESEVGGCPHTWRVDPVAGSWTPGPALPEDRVGGHGLALDDGRILLFGGDRARITWLNPGTDTWVEGPPAPRSIGTPTIGRLDDGRIVAAGSRGDGLENAVVWFYDPGGEPLPMPPDFEVSRETDRARALCLAEPESCP